MNRPPQMLSPDEMPPITDWEDFALWCQQHGRKALPASRETLSLYFADRQATHPERNFNTLGLLSLISAITGILLPILLGMFALLKGMENLDLMIRGCALLFVGLQLIAFGSGVVSRQSPVGRAGLTISIVSVGLPLIYLSWSWIQPKFWNG